MPKSRSPQARSGKRQRVDEEDEDEDDLESLFSSPKRHRTTAPTPGSGLVPSYSYLINSIYTGRMEANVPDVVLSPLGPVGWPSRRYRRNLVVTSPFTTPLTDIDASTTQNGLLPGVGTFFAGSVPARPTELLTSTNCDINETSIYQCESEMNY